MPWKAVTSYLWGIVLAASIGFDCSASYAYQDSISLSHENFIDLTADGYPEHLLVSARGMAWTDLSVRFEIRSQYDSLLFAMEWKSGAWFGNIYYVRSEQDAEQRARQYVASVVDSSRYVHGLPGSARTDVRRRGMRWIIRLDIAESYWRQKYHAPMHEHLILMSDGRMRADEFSSMITDEHIERLIDECINGPSFAVRPHWDAVYGIVWSKQEQRFVIAEFIG